MAEQPKPPPPQRPLAGMPQVPHAQRDLAVARLCDKLVELADVVIERLSG